MARVKARPIDREYNAIRNRLGPRTSIASSGGGPAVVPPHTHAASEISNDPNTDAGGLVEATKVQTAIDELDTEKLARDGSQVMLGALDLDHHSIENVDDLDVEGTATVGENVTLTGTVGAAVVSGVRVLEMAGDQDDNEAEVTGVERIAFNAEVAKSRIENLGRVEMLPAVVASDYTPAVGVVAWDANEGALVAWVASGS